MVISHFFVQSPMWRPGGDGVWALANQGINRFDSSRESVVRLAGLLTQIAVGSGMGVFGINSSNQLCTWVWP